MNVHPVIEAEQVGQRMVAEACAPLGVSRSALQE